MAYTLHIMCGQLPECGYIAVDLYTRDILAGPSWQMHASSVSSLFDVL